MMSLMLTPIHINKIPIIKFIMDIFQIYFVLPKNQVVHVKLDKQATVKLCTFPSPTNETEQVDMIAPTVPFANSSF